MARTVTGRAAIDIGSNAARLLVTDGEQPVLRRSRVTALAEGMDEAALLSTAALARTARALEGHRAALDECGARLARVVGTATARTAGNGDVLARLVEDILGRPLDVLAPEDEARLTFLGATGGNGRGRCLVVDIGGGSTEMAVGDAEPEGVASLDLGSAALTAAELPSDPPRPEELSNAIALVQERIDEALRALPAVDEWTPVVGTGGTILTVAAVEIGLPLRRDASGTDDGDVDDPSLHGFVLTRPAAEDVFRTLAREALADRVHNPGLPRRRGATVVGGCCILVGLLRRLQVPALTVSVSDLLDGILREAL